MAKIDDNPLSPRLLNCLIFLFFVHDFSLYILPSNSVSITVNCLLITVNYLTIPLKQFQRRYLVIVATPELQNIALFKIREEHIKLCFFQIANFVVIKPKPPFGITLNRQAKR